MHMKCPYDVQCTWDVRMAYHWDFETNIWLGSEWFDEYVQQKFEFVFLSVFSCDSFDDKADWLQNYTNIYTFMVSAKYKDLIAGLMSQVLRMSV